MTELVLDGGNTRIKAGVFVQGAWEQTILLDYDSDPAACIGRFNPQRILASDVSGKLHAWLGKAPGTVPVLWLEPETPLPFNNLYKSAHTLGADRKALVAGAMHLYPGKDLLVIDAGTCVTFDLITASHDYLGGSISPGFVMRLNAMHTFTGKLPMPPVSVPNNILGQDTHACLLSGAWFGLLGEISYRKQAYEEKYPGLITLLSGGDALELAKRLKTDIFVNEQLALIGLHRIFC